MFIISGWTPIHAASYKGYTEICDLLLTHGADVTKGNIETGNNIGVEFHFHNKIYNNITTYLCYNKLKFHIFIT